MLGLMYEKNSNYYHLLKRNVEGKKHNFLVAFLTCYRSISLAEKILLLQVKSLKLTVLKVRDYEKRPVVGMAYW